MNTKRIGLVGVALAGLGIGVAAYLTAVRVAGELPACGPLRGCETVALSRYSEIAGVPVAVLGLLFSLAVLVAQLAWWRRGNPNALLVAFGLGVFGLAVVSYLTYLEIAVIGAICVWCVAYALTVVGGLVVTAIGVRDG